MNRFLGYGTPEALDAAIKADQDDAFRLYSIGLFFSSVCSSLGMEETVARMRNQVSGTTNGYQFSSEPFVGGLPNPGPCNDKPETHMHYLFEV